MPDLRWPTPPDAEPPVGDAGMLRAVHDRATRLRRRRRSIVAGAAGVVLIVAGASIAIAIDGGRSDTQHVVTAPTTTATPATTTTLDAAPPVRYPPAPVDCPGSLVDTTNAGLVQARAPGPAFGEPDYPRQYVAHWTVDEQTIELHVPATAVRDLVGERTEPVALGAGEGTVWFRPDSVQVRGPTGLTDPLMCDSFDVTVSGPDEADNRELGIKVAAGLEFGPQVDDGHGAAVDYVNAVTHDGITYISQRPADLAGADLGDALFEVETTDSMQEPAAGFGQREGEATYLTRGTRVYAVDGFDPRFRVAAELDGVLALFEADTVPGATTGADLFDLDGQTKVVRISINSELDGTTELASIDDSGIIQQMVDDVLAAPVDQTQQPTTELRYFIAFHFADAPPVIRAYWPQERLLHRGVLVPPSFQEHVAAADP